MELHKFAYKFDEDYASVWSKFYGATGTSMLNANGSWKTDSVIEGMLDEWKEWAMDAPNLTTEERRVADGPPECVTVFDRAEINGCKFTCSRLERAKKAKDSIVVIMDHATIPPSPVVGQVLRFLEWRSSSGMKHNIADVKWFAKPPGPHRFDAKTKCPVVLNTTKDDPDGNFWCCSAILPTNIILAPHPKFPTDKFLVMHQDSDFLRRFQV